MTNQPITPPIRPDVELIDNAEGNKRILASDRAAAQRHLDNLDAPRLEPWSCTGTVHEHRWLRFGKNGERDEVVVDVDAAGLVSISEQVIELLLREAGFAQHDVDPVESAWLKRKEWARSRLQEALNRRAR